MKKNNNIMAMNVYRAKVVISVGASPIDAIVENSDNIHYIHPVARTKVAASNTFVWLSRNLAISKNVVKKYTFIKKTGELSSSELKEYNKLIVEPRNLAKCRLDKVLAIDKDCNNLAAKLKKLTDDCEHRTESAKELLKKYIEAGFIISYEELYSSDDFSSVREIDEKDKVFLKSCEDFVKSVNEIETELVTENKKYLALVSKRDGISNRIIEIREAISKLMAESRELNESLRIVQGDIDKTNNVCDQLTDKSSAKRIEYMELANKRIENISQYSEEFERAFSTKVAEYEKELERRRLIQEFQEKLKELTGEDYVPASEVKEKEVKQEVEVDKPIDNPIVMDDDRDAEFRALATHLYLVRRRKELPNKEIYKRISELSYELKLSFDDFVQKVLNISSCCFYRRHREEFVNFGLEIYKKKVYKNFNLSKEERSELASKKAKKSWEKRKAKINIALPV